jgi:MFS family permease
MILKAWGWEAAFYVCGAPGLLLALTCLLIAEPVRQHVPDKVPIARTLRGLLRIPLYRRVVLGYVFHTAAVGAFAHWGPSFISLRYGMELASAGFWFGLVTVAAGAIATIVGGILVDRAQRQVDGRGGSAGLRERRAIGEMIRICGIGMLIAAPATVVLFWMPSALPFFVFAFIAEIGVFLSTSPVNAATLRSVPPGLRASAMAASIFAIHLFGDIWTPAALGGFIDVMPLAIAMMFLPLLFAGGAWAWWPRASEIEISDAEADAISAAAMPGGPSARVVE